MFNGFVAPGVLHTTELPLTDLASHSSRPSVFMLLDAMAKMVPSAALHSGDKS